MEEKNNIQISKCPNCHSERAKVDIDKVPNPPRKDFANLIKQMGGFVVHCEKCGDFSFVANPQIFN